MKVPKAIRKPSGSWQIQLRLGGKSITINRQTEAEAITEAERIKAEWNAGKRDRPVIRKTLEAACCEYIDLYRSRLSPTTIQGYEKIVKNSFSDLMKANIYDITFRDLEKAVSDECNRSGRSGKRSPKTISNEFNFIFSILKYNDINIKRPRLPERKRVPVQILTVEQVYKAVAGTDIELPCLLAMWLTLTISEIRGLTKSKSIRNNQLTVVETVVDVYGVPTRKPGGKEASRTRTLLLPPYLAYLIDLVEGDIICPLSAQAVYKRLQRYLGKAGLPKITFHQLRHISASTMVGLGIPPAYVKQTGGWATDQIMNSIYVHTYQEQQAEFTERMNAYMNNIIATNNATVTRIHRTYRKKTGVQLPSPPPEKVNETE